MRKILLSLLLLLSSATALYAIPAKRTPRIVSQPDGTQLTIMLCGDEHMHYLCTPDGTPVVKGKDGTYCYATLNGSEWKSSGRAARNAAERSPEEADFAKGCRPTNEALRNLYAQRMQQRTARTGHTVATRAASAGTCPDGQTPPNITGKQRGLVVLANFNDVKFTIPDIRTAIERQMNEVGYNDNGNSGSVHDYFLEQSYGQFDLTFDVVGPVTLSRNEGYYGEDSSTSFDIHAPEMVVEAVKLVHEQYPELNFAQYDWNNDGKVDQVYIIHAGYDQASGAPEDAIWSHEWELSSAGLSLQIDGVNIDTYACSSELCGSGLDDETPVLDGIGSACHEFSHCLGLPDLYYTGNSTGVFGMDMWSVLDYGNYAGDGFRPVAYTAYERWTCGWLTPIELSAGATVTNMPALAERPVAYVIHNDLVPTEYYLLENRQPVGTDSDIQGHGLLVTHLDYDASVWKLNLVNNTVSHQRCTVIPADNALNGRANGDGSLLYTDDLAGDPYPGTSGNTKLTDLSRPAAKLYNKNASGIKYMSKPITQIAESADGLISFEFMGGGEVIDGLHEAQNEAQGSEALLPTTPVSVYAADGRFIGTETYAAFGKDASVPSGVYLLRTPNGTTVKAVKRTHE